MSGGRRGGQGRQFPDFSGFLVLKSSLISQINSQGIMSANATRVLSSYWRMPRGVLLTCLQRLHVCAHREKKNHLP
jgi:hypothetical protein